MKAQLDWLIIVFINQEPVESVESVESVEPVEPVMWGDYIIGEWLSKLLGKTDYVKLLSERIRIILRKVESMVPLIKGWKEYSEKKF